MPRLPSKRPAVCYVIPHYSADERQHFAHLPRFLAELGNLADVCVIVEKGVPCNDFRNIQAAYWQRYGHGNRILRSIEFMLLVLRVHRQGYRHFFVRISVPATIILCILARFFRMKIYYWFSGQPTNVFPPAMGLGSYLRRLRLRLGILPVTLALRLAHRVVTGPERMGDYLAREFGVDRNRTVILYNDIDAAPYSSNEDRKAIRLRLGLPVDRSIVLFVGRVSLLKGGYNLLPIINTVIPCVQDALFVIVGPERINELRAGVDRLGYNRHVVLLGEVPNLQVVSYYQAADLFILPSESEGFPRVLLEAMAAGLPIVAFDVGGVRDIVDETQRTFIVPRGDHAAFGKQVVRLLRAPDMRSRQGTISQQRVQHFATPKVARMFVERLLHE